MLGPTPVVIIWQASIDGQRVPDLDMKVMAQEGGSLPPSATARIVADELTSLARWDLVSAVQAVINRRRDG